MQGLEFRNRLIYHYGVRGGRITLEQMCRCLSENPAKLYGLYPKKGVIAPGSDADLVVWDTKAKWTLQSKELQSASDYCPYEGASLSGRAEKVYLRGELAAENGEIIKAFLGQYVRGVHTNDRGFLLK